MLYICDEEAASVLLFGVNADAITAGGDGIAGGEVDAHVDGLGVFVSGIASEGELICG